jgi:DNA-binding NtrC family response regulator
LYTLLANYAFPGNVRELRGLIYNAVGTHSGGMLSLASLKERLLGDVHATPADGEATAVELTFPDPLPTLREVEDALVAEAVKRADGNKSMAAQLIGVTRKTIRARLGSE